MTRLLVSVADAQEAAEAVEHGADLIDVKDPTAGSLGAASVAVQQEVIAAVNGRVHVSAALGELTDDSSLELAAATVGMRFAKVGLANHRLLLDWEGRWIEWRQRLAPRVRPVAVVYADWQTCGAVSPADVMQALLLYQRCSIVLIDTFDKAKGSLLDIWTVDVLMRLTHVVQRAGSQVVIAGSLQLKHLPDLLPLEPDYIAVRGAVCRGKRTARLCGELVREWADALTQGTNGNVAR